MSGPTGADVFASAGGGHLIDDLPVCLDPAGDPVAPQLMPLNRGFGRSECWQTVTTRAVGGTEVGLGAVGRLWEVGVR